MQNEEGHRACEKTLYFMNEMVMPANLLVLRAFTIDGDSRSFGYR